MPRPNIRDGLEPIALDSVDPLVPCRGIADVGRGVAEHERRDPLRMPKTSALSCPLRLPDPMFAE